MSWLRYSSSETRKGSSARPGGAEQERRELSPRGDSASASSTEASIKVLLYLTRLEGKCLGSHVASDSMIDRDVGELKKYDRTRKGRCGGSLHVSVG